MTSNGSANEPPRGTRAKELNNAETGGENDITTMILANDAPYDFKARRAGAFSACPAAPIRRSLPWHLAPFEVPPAGGRLRR
jgi:hypothetical protein